MKSCPDRSRRLLWTAASGRAAVALSALILGGASIATAADTRWGADYFPNVSLTTHEGKTVRFFDDLIKDKIVAIDLIYTTCQYACPLETARLAQVQRLIGDRMGRDVFFYSITIDPDHDTPAVLDEYARRFHAGPGWLFLTGSKSDIALLSRKLGLYSPPDPRNPDGHLPYVLVGNQATGQWMRNSAVDNPKFLARTIGDWLNGWHATARPPLTSRAESAPFALNEGQYAFGYHCAACHTVGGGTRIGPDLDGVTARRDRDWLRRFIAAPDRMNAAGDPIARELRAAYGNARMPNLDLSDEDVSAIIDYLNERSAIHGSPPASATSSTAASPPASRTTEAIVASYLRIQGSLRDDAIDSIGAEAGAIDREATALGAAGESIRSAAAAIRGTTDLAAARLAFAALSDRIIAWVRSSGAPPAEVVVAFCPMAQKYWLQKGERIQNPYYGKAMPDCGRVVR